MRLRKRESECYRGEGECVGEEFKDSGKATVWENRSYGGEENVTAQGQGGTGGVSRPHIFRVQETSATTCQRETIRP